MHFIDILDRYAAGPDDAMATDAAQYFEEVAQSAPREVVSDGIADAFRADQTPPFGDMVAQLFLHSDAQQRAGVLNQILAAVGPSTFANGPLGELFAYFRDGSRISDDEADAILPHQVREIADTAEKHDPGVIERVSAFYARHPGLMRNLGNDALALALRNMARHARH